MTTSINASRRHFSQAMMALAAMGAAGPVFSQGRPAPFKVGALNSITGAGGTYGPGMLEAIKIGIAEVNAAGGAAGRELKLYAEDDQTRPDAAVLAARKLVDIQHVDAMIGIWSSAVQLATLPITNAAGILSFNTCGAPEIRTEDKRDLVFQFYASNAIIGAAFAAIGQRLGYKRAAVLGYNNATMSVQANHFKAAWEKKGNQIVSSAIYEPNQATYRTEVEKAVAAKPDVIVLSSYTPDATILLKEWYQTGYECKFIMPGYSATPALIKALGPDVMRNIVSTANVPASDNQAYKAFVEKFQAVTKSPPEMFAAAAYDMVITLALAIEAAGPDAKPADLSALVRQVSNPPGQKVSSFVQGRDLLRQKAKIDFDGASSSLDFDANGDTVPDFGIYEFDGKAFALKDVVPGATLM
ncbi:ABC transporter substrate-binding protein [Bordetella parapertussis]|uniref:ABC transport system, solute-binding protein n=2 Tax=Bordetella parapertussis TaxID=519 RepID=Q7W8M5_BORPA|nr:ABC transporter substrate-binding protein [Bordetella parapertussis]AOB39249.1 amino acid ABC transporter substrate-binding protein [Bordetella parapertussis]AUL43242.1 amino acid ABC transporter substrate-binding protein [Bordetella parapertussis]AWP63241.1 amino acid ABC transporter substrate-binding protein [Bordetella parapertussis]AWP70739.1 amino acid ABC transporter substrate-binding protein [Bordetella parapertussis]AWP89245.1 amino acid ABC transporter substrate-binding protein [Bo